MIETTRLFSRISGNPIPVFVRRPLGQKPGRYDSAEWMQGSWLSTAWFDPSNELQLRFA